MNFQKLTDYLDSLESVGIPGCDLAVWQDYKPIYRHQAGWKDAVRTIPANGTEVYRLYSVSKVILAVSIMRLKETPSMECGYCYATIHPAIRDLIYECMEA